MIRIGLFHEVPRVRALYEAVLRGRGYAVVTGPLSSAAPRSALQGYDLLVVHVPDGPSGLERLAALQDTITTVCIDDDADPARDRWLTDHGFDRVLHGPILLRDLVEAIEAVLDDRRPPRRTADQATARIVHDSRQERDRLLDTRGTAPARGRHLLLEAGELQVTLHCFPRDTRLRLLGTVTGIEEPILARVELDDGARIRRTRTDEVGRFEFTDVTPGDARLRIDGRGWAIDIPVELVAT
jgi:DNA-binding response OmpR family regulator